MKQARASAFVDKVRDRIRQCGRANLGTTVTRLAETSTRSTDLSVWALTIELNDRQSFPFLMAVVRDGTAVSPAPEGTEVPVTGPGARPRSSSRPFSRKAVTRGSLPRHRAVTSTLPGSKVGRI